jgi:hypothetical protein
VPSDSEESVERVQRWKVRCYNCGWCPTVGDRGQADREARRHRRECDTKAEVLSVESTLKSDEVWTDTSASEVLETDVR